MAGHRKQAIATIYRAVFVTVIASLLAIVVYSPNQAHAAEKLEPLHILLTNDDGYSTVGILVGTGSSGTAIAPFMDKRIQGIRDKGLRAYLPEYFPELLSQAFLASGAGKVLTGMYLANAEGLDAEAVCRMYEALKAYEVKNRIERISTPTLILAGEHDMARGMCQEINGLIAGATLHILPGGSHACCTDTPREFNEILLSFLSELPSSV